MNEINDFIRHFAEQLDETKFEELNENTAFRDLDDWSSLVALSVISMIDDEYDVVINGNEMRNAKTIKDLFDIVESKK